jgi:hypothetical protein
LIISNSMEKDLVLSLRSIEITQRVFWMSAAFFGSMLNQVGSKSDGYYCQVSPIKKNLCLSFPQSPCLSLSLYFLSREHAGTSFSGNPENR